MSIDTILLIVAFVCFVLVAAGIPTGRVNALGVGLAAWVLTALV